MRLTAEESLSLRITILGTKVQRNFKMRRPGRLAQRFIQYTGGLAIPTIVLGELYAGA